MKVAVKTVPSRDAPTHNQRARSMWAAQMKLFTVDKLLYPSVKPLLLYTTQPEPCDNAKLALARTSCSQEVLGAAGARRSNQSFKSEATPLHPSVCLSTYFWPHQEEAKTWILLNDVMWHRKHTVRSHDYTYGSAALPSELSMLAKQRGRERTDTAG